MAKDYRCGRCDYVWKADKPKYCPRCYSEKTKKLNPVRDSISSTKKNTSGSISSAKKRFQMRFPGFKDYAIDTWNAIKGPLFVLLILILLIIFALIYVYYI